jgi:hypothetical protein
MLTSRMTVALAILGAFVIGGMAFGIAWSQMDATQRAAIWPDLAKAGMQTVVVAVAGALVTVALKMMEEQRAVSQKAQDVEREDRERRNTYRLELVRRLRKAYTDIKRARRRLETAGFRHGLGPVPAPSLAIYAKALTALTEAKLEIEAINEELEAGVEVPGSVQQIKDRLKLIENYLDAQAIEEYRTHAYGLLTKSTTLTFEHFPRVKIFAGDARTSCDSFGPRLADPYHAAIDDLVQEILVPTAVNRSQSKHTKCSLR